MFILSRISEKAYPSWFCLLPLWKFMLQCSVPLCLVLHFLSEEAIVRFPTCKGQCHFPSFLPPGKDFIDNLWTELGGSGSAHLLLNWSCSCVKLKVFSAGRYVLMDAGGTQQVRDDLVCRNTSGELVFVLSQASSVNLNKVFHGLPIWERCLKFDVHLYAQKLLMIHTWNRKYCNRANVYHHMGNM